MAEGRRWLARGARRGRRRHAGDARRARTSPPATRRSARATSRRRRRVHAQPRVGATIGRARRGARAARVARDGGRRRRGARARRAEHRARAGGGRQAHRVRRARHARRARGRGRRLRGGGAPLRARARAAPRARRPPARRQLAAQPRPRRLAAGRATTAATALLEEALVLARAVEGHVERLGRAREPRPRRSCCATTPALARGLLLDGLRLARDRNDRRVAAELVQGLAAVLASEGRQADAARLLGAADALRETTGAALSPAEVLIGERFLAPVRASLGDAAFDAEQTAGRRLGIDEVLALAAEPRRPARRRDGHRARRCLPRRRQGARRFCDRRFAAACSQTCTGPAAT